jgi:hypothetical protein
MAVTPMTGLYPNDDVTEHVVSVAMDLLASGRATATEVADLSGISLKRVKRWIDHNARGVWLANQWNSEMARLEDDHLDEALRGLDLHDGSIESMGYIPSRYLAHS